MNTTYLSGNTSQQGGQSVKLQTTAETEGSSNFAGIWFFNKQNSSDELLMVALHEKSRNQVITVHPLQTTNVCT